MQDGRASLKFPLCKELLEFSKAPVTGRLKEVKVKPFHDIFHVFLVLDDGQPEPALSKAPERICAIDFGASNFAAISNNAGLPFLLFKGGVLKSQNQWYNKKIAELKSEQAKGTTVPFNPMPASEKLCAKRENQVIDFARKFCKRVVDWCLDNQIDTIVVGKNDNWKQ